MLLPSKPRQTPDVCSTNHVRTAVLSCPVEQGSTRFLPKLKTAEHCSAGTAGRLSPRSLWQMSSNPLPAAWQP